MNEQESILSDLETEKPVKASGGKQYVANLLDGIIGVGIIYLLYKILPYEALQLIFSRGKIGAYLTVLFLIIFTRFISIQLLGKTLGMQICRLRFLNEDLQPLSSKEKMLAVLATSPFGIQNYNM
ncbi:MAG: RDD family protein [Ferruginibacter sp.]